MSTEPNVNGRVSAANERVADALEPGHVVALSACKRKEDTIRYACEQIGRPTTGQVRVWLERYGVATSRPNTSRVVNAWRKEHGLSDTGDLPAFTDEVMEEIAKRTADRQASNASAVPSERVSNASAVPSERVSNASAVPSERVSNASAVPSERVSNASARGEDIPEVERRHSGSAVPAPAGKHKAPAGALGFYIVAVMALGVSVDTSLAFFGERLHVPDPARFFLFGVMEAALLACGSAMAQNVRRHGAPGAPRFIAWALCGLAAFAALDLSGPLEGPLRAALGPVLSLVMLHSALGIEIRAGHTRTTTWSRVLAEYRERFLSRLGLSNEHRDAATRARERAARRYGDLQQGRFVPFRTARLRRAVRIADFANHPEIKELARRHHDHVRDLCGLGKTPYVSVWTDTEDASSVSAVPSERVSNASAIRNKRR